MDNTRRKICICYVITSFLISALIYCLISGNLQNNRKLNQLREEVDEIAHVILHSGPGGHGESKHLSEIVDGILKKRLAGIWEDLYAVKKQVKANDCATTTLKTDTNCLGVKSLNRVNYAAEELGAKIYHVVADPVGGSNIFRSLLRLDFSCNPPVNMLTHSMEPGNCFGFLNNKSEVTVKLAKEIFVEAIELEHITSAYSPTGDITSAPKTLAVYGIDSKSCKVESLLGNFVYENSPANRAQLFTTKIVEKFHFIRFKFETNHGHPNYTCVYRIAVYGKMH